MCNSAAAFQSQYFGYQIPNSGTVQAMAVVAVQNTRPIYTPSNPLNFTPEMGMNGYRYGLDARKIVSPFIGNGYEGILPLKEQPRLEAPYPYQVPTVL